MPKLHLMPRPLLCLEAIVLTLVCLAAVAGGGHASEWKGRAMLAVDYQGSTDLDNPNGELRIEDQNGNNIAVSDFERSWYVGAAMKLPF